LEHLPLNESCNLLGLKLYLLSGLQKGVQLQKLSMRKIAITIALIVGSGIINGSAQPMQVKSGSKKIALTFDACMTRGMLERLEKGLDKSLYDPSIIEYLHHERIAATLFISGLWAEKYSSAVKDFASDTLFEIGNHSYGHKGFVPNCYSLPNLPNNDKRNDILKTQEVLTNLSGRKPRLFRFPGGCYSPSDLLLVKNMGLKVVGWTFPSGDAFNYDSKAVIQYVLSNAKSDAIIVFHLSGGRYAPRTAEIIKAIIPLLRKQGYEFSRVSDLPRYK